MPRCKLSNCREEAVPYGKRYCPKHKAEYEAKRKACHERAAKAPKCIDCKETPVFDGTEVCRSCQDVRDERRAYYTKMDQFESVKTVQELKDWIREYML